MRLVIKAPEWLKPGDVIGAETFPHDREFQIWPKTRVFRSFVNNPDGPGFLVEWEGEAGNYLYGNYQQFVVIEGA